MKWYERESKPSEGMCLGAWSKVMEFELNHLYNVDDIAGGAQFIKINTLVVYAFKYKGFF